MVQYNPAEPATQTEIMLVDIWKNVLGLETLGIHDEFFTLGGHSLSGTQLISRINRIFCIRMPLQSLFEKSTISALGKEIDRLQQEAIMNETDLEHLLREVESLPADDK